MTKELHILHLEDNEADAKLALRELRSQGIDFTVKRVLTEDGFHAELRNPALDLILADYALPSYDGMSALAAACQERPEVPFIFVTGSMGEENEIEALHKGATDYVLKQRLSRLCPAVKRALHEVEIVRERKRAEEHIRRLNQLLWAIRDINMLIVSARDAHRLLAEACDILMRRRGYLLVWIGRPESDSKQVIPVARAGQRADYLDHITVTWDESATGQGPVGTALRTWQPWLCQDTATDPRFAEWRAPALERGYLSMAAMPMLHGGHLFGVISVYADRVSAFDDEEAGLLKELAGDMALALHSIEQERERQRTEDKIRAQANLLDLAHDGIVVIDMEEQIQYFNQGAVTLYGWTVEEVMGRKVTDLIWRDTESWRAAMDKLLQDGQWAGEVQQQGKDQRELIVNSHWTLVRNAQGRPASILTINTDITEQKKREAQFLRNQRLECLGTLASGIGHDLNNILAPIMMSVEMLRQQEDPELVERTIALIEISVRRGADIIKQLLSFGRGITGARVAIHPKSPIRDVVEIARETFPKSITTGFSTPADLWLIMGDYTQVHQVLLNLFINSRDAMPAGGSLRIEAENVRVDEKEARLSPDAKPGPYVRIGVTDTGEGIPPENMEKIFNVFFTTKAVGKGTGLGLSTVIGIVKNHGGFVKVRSEVGLGSCFEVFLPALLEQESAGDTPQRPISPRGHGELILLVDDELQVRHCTSQILEINGYEVWTAKDGSEALTLYTQHPNFIDVVVTDLMMPNLDGMSLIRAVHDMEPSQRIIATTGLSSTLELKKTGKELKALGATQILLKPFTGEALLTAIHEILQKNPV